MGIYLKKFETQSAYEAAQSGLILPNVSFTVDNNTVHYNPSTPPTPSHDYVEIGGIKWATMNVGASSITDYGLYFQWGDTQGYTADQVGSGSGQKAFTWNDYKYGTWDSFTKYNYTDGLTVLQPSDDAVTAAWGDNWRMPTVSEFIALEEAVETAWTQVNGVSGLMCTDKTDETKTLFFPACGYAEGDSLNYVGSNGSYWSSSVDTDSDSHYAHNVYFNEFDIWWDIYYGYTRIAGCAVRGVLAN